MNKIVLLVATCYFLTGCVSVNNTNDSVFDYAVDENNLPSGIFTYYQQPSSIYLPVDYRIEARFIIENDCLILQTEFGTYTPIFPVKYTKYEEGDTEIILHGKSLKIGELVEVPAVPSDRRDIGVKVEGQPYYVTKGQPQCLTENLIKIERW